jgi:hypothetical protein
LKSSAAAKGLGPRVSTSTILICALLDPAQEVDASGEIEGVF